MSRGDYNNTGARHVVQFGVSVFIETTATALTDVAEKSGRSHRLDTARDGAITEHAPDLFVRDTFKRFGKLPLVSDRWDKLLQFAGAVMCGPGTAGEGETLYVRG